MTTNKAMYNEYCEAMRQVENYKYYDYCEDFHQSSMQEEMYYYACDKAKELKDTMARLPKIAKMKVYRWTTTYDLETGEKCDRCREEIELNVIGKRVNDDIVLFEYNGHIYTGEVVKELGWKSYKKNGKPVISKC